MIRGNEVCFGVEQVNEVYVLLNAGMADLQAKGFEPGTWMASILFPNRELSWAAIEREISMHDFTEDVRINLNIIYRRVFPCTHMTSITDM